MLFGEIFFSTKSFCDTKVAELGETLIQQNFQLRIYRICSSIHVGATLI